MNLEITTHTDAKELSPIEQRLEVNNLKPETLYGDAGFVNGESFWNLLREVGLAGPSSGRSQSFEGFIDVDRPLDIADFQISVDDENGDLTVLSCPEGHEVIDPRPSDSCKSCAYRERCPSKIGIHKSTLDVSEAQYAGVTRHHEYMGNKEYRKECGIRAGAESLVNEIANAHDGRQSRHQNEKGSRLQLIFAGISCNVKRFVHPTQNFAKNP